MPPRHSVRAFFAHQIRVVVVLGAVLTVVLSFTGCRERSRGRPFSTAFGVAIGDIPATAEQLDALGPVWYMDYNWNTPTLPGHDRLYVIRCWEVQAPLGRDGRRVRQPTPSGRDGVPTDKGAIAAAMKASGSAWWSLGNEPNDPNQDNVSAEAYAELYHAFEGWAAGAPGCRLVSAGIGNADWNWAEAFREAYRRKYGKSTADVYWMK